MQVVRLCQQRQGYRMLAALPGSPRALTDPGETFLALTFRSHPMECTFQSIQHAHLVRILQLFVSFSFLKSKISYKFQIFLSVSGLDCIDLLEEEVEEEEEEAQKQEREEKDLAYRF